MDDLTTRAGLLAALAAERSALDELLPRFDEARWRAGTRADGWTAHDITMHLADANYGMALMVLGEIQPTLPQASDGWIDPHDYNEQRRRKNAGLSHERALQRIAGAFDAVRRACETVDLDAPGPYGSDHSKRAWLARIVEHTRSHRAELAELLGDGR